MPQKHHVIHGRDHLPSGADPIPGLIIETAGTYSDWVLDLPGTWGYWPLQEASGAAIDQGPTGADCSPVGTPAYRVTGPNTTDLPYAVRLTGTAQNTISDDSFYNSTDELGVGSYNGDMTVLCWIRPDSASDITKELPIIGVWDQFRLGWVLTLLQSSRELVWNTGNGTDNGFVRGPVIPNDTWSFVAATRSGSTWKLYVDGAEVTTVPGGIAVFSGSGHGIRLGAVNRDYVDPDAHHFYGDMAGAVWVDSVLSGGDILQAYNAGAGSGLGSRANVYTSTGTPVSTLGTTGDLCFAIATGDVYHKTAGGWTLLGALT